MKTVKEVYDFFQQGVSTAGKDLRNGGTSVPVSQKN